MSQINVTVIGSTAECSLVSNCDTVNVTFADQSGGAGTGTAATIEVGSVTTVTATESASVVNEGTGYAAKLAFKIPRGATSGLSIGTVTSGTAAAATITGSAPSQTLSLTLPAGPPNSLSIGTVTSGTAAAATITGAAPSQVLSLTLPVGSTGSQGPQGDAGPANSLSIGTVTGGTAAAASITGSAPSQVLSLVLPVGATGPAGPQGATGPAGPPINLGDETPQPLGTASAGTALTAARADHIHAVPTIAYSSLAGVPSNFPSNIASVSGLQAALDGKQAAGNYATLVGGTVPSSQLPSFVDDCLEYAALSGFPATGEVGKIYVARDTNKTYRWSGSTYVEISASPGSTDAVPEGSTNLYHTTKRAADAAPVQSVAGRTGTVTLTAADVSGVVSGVNNLTGNLTLAAGANITITPSGSTLTISGAAAGIGANDAVDGGDLVGELIYPNTIIIASQTSNQTASGGSATFSISGNVDPSGTLAYQWQRSDDGGASWINIASATASNLTVTNLTNASDNGDLYRVYLSAAGADSVTSDSAALTVPLSGITVTQQPSNQTAVDGAAAFSVAAVVYPSGTLSYQWQRSDDSGTSWSNVSGATSTTLSLTGLTNAADDGDQYRVVVSSSGFSNVTSSAVTLTVPAASVSITQQPADQTASGGAATFSVTASVSPSGTPTYQWDKGDITEANGAAWTQRTLPASAAWRSVAYGGGVYAAVSSGGPGATSTDGATWTQRTTGNLIYLTAIAYGGSRFVAVGSSGKASRSVDGGETWSSTGATGLSQANYYGVAYGAGLFVAVGGTGAISGGSTAATSPDGVTWTTATLPQTGRRWGGVEYGGGQFVAFGAFDTVAATSPDGTTWTQRSLPAVATCAAHGNGLWVAMCNAQNTFGGSPYNSAALTSTDGVTWTPRPIAISTQWRSVTYGNGVFVAVSAASGSIAATSPDGINWTQRTLPASASWYDIAFGASRFVAVASGGTVAATSDDSYSWSQVSGATSSSLALTGLTNAADDGDKYRAVVSAIGAAPVTSNAATLTVS